MAESEDFRLKRNKHEERLSRVFDEVMGLGDFADSSRGSATSSRSSSQEETKGVEENSGQGEQQQAGEEDSNGSRREEKMDEGPGPRSSSPHLASPSSERHSPFAMGPSGVVGGGGGGGGGSGGAASDDALDGLPSYGAEEEEEEEDEDWHFALPMETLEDVDMDKTNKRSSHPDGKAETQGDPFVSEQREEEGEGEGSSVSANTSHSSQDHSPENSQDGAVLNQTGETEDSQQGERSEVTAPVEDSNPPICPSINIKDEPIDEGYDAALLPQSSIRQIKEELEHQEEELRISSVYSVGGNTFSSPTAPGPAPQPAAIFIPGRGAVLQAAAMAPLPFRPSVPASLQSLAPGPSLPPQPPVPGSVRCSGCSKVLLKGQTAFQRKGSTQLFCSTVCLTGHLPPACKARFCFQCNKEITQPKDMIMIPLDASTYMHFCGQFCLSVFRHKKKQADKQPEKRPEKRSEKRLEKKPEKQPEKQVEKQPEKPFCGVCRVTNRIEHEVTHQGRLHRLCSDGCFLTWRKTRQLAMNCCEGCGLYCNSNSGSCQTLTIDRSQLNFCSPTCICTYKQSCTKMTECANCRKVVTVSSTIVERDQKGKVQLYCSSVCVEQSRPPRHMLTGTAFPCCLCKVSAVPQYHLAMVDGTIRNFCSYDCVSVYRKMGHTSPPELTNGTSSLRDPSLRDTPRPVPSAGASSVAPISQEFSTPVPSPGHHPSHTSVPSLLPPYPNLSSPSVPGQVQARVPPGQHPKPGEGGASDPSKLTCNQCSKQFSAKPLLFSYQGRIYMFCNKACCEQYKTQKNILAVCECCKLEKVLFDIITYNQQDMVFCSESCKLLFKHDLTSRNKDQPWRPCSYCACIGQKMLHSHYGGRMEEFCRPHCMSQYTVLYYGMARCDSCRKQGYMTEKLQCLGSVRNFCTLPCLLQYCHLHFETNQRISSNGTGSAPLTPYAPIQPHHSSKMNPVIADVVSLASGSATQPHVTADTALTGALPTSNTHGKNLGNASTQTDATRVPVSRRRQMKNKSVLCRPFTMDQESLCQLLTPASESAAVSAIAPAQLASPSQPAPSSTEGSSEASTSPAPSPKPQGDIQPCDNIPARLTGRHFPGKRETGNSDCKVCAKHKRKRVEEEEEEERERKRGKVEEEQEKTMEEEEEMKGMNSEGENCVMQKGCEQENGTERRQTLYYCRTCPGEPSLCPVPCFELYHTRLIYRSAPELETQGLSLLSFTSSVGEEKVKMVMVPVPVPVFIPVPMNMYSQHTPVPVAMPMPVPVPMVIPSQNKEVKDAAVQSEHFAEGEEVVWKDKLISHADQDMVSGDMETETPISWEDEETRRKGCAMQTGLPGTVCKEESTGSTAPLMATKTEGSTGSTAPLMATKTEGSMGSTAPLMASKTEGSTGSTAPLMATKTEGSTGSTAPLMATKTEGSTGSIAPLMAIKTEASTGSTQPFMATKTEGSTGATAPLMVTKTEGSTGATEPITATKTEGSMGSTVPVVDTKTEGSTVSTEPLTATKTEGTTGSTESLMATKTEGSTGSTEPLTATKTECSTGLTEPLMATKTQENTGSTEPLTATKTEGSMGSTEPLMTTQTQGSTGSNQPLLTTQTEESMESTKPQTIAQSEGSTGSTEPVMTTQTEGSMGTSDPPSTSAENQTPSSPMMDLETDFPSELLDQKSSVPQRGVKRPREGFPGRKRGRRRTGSLDRSAMVSPALPKLNHLYGVKAWRSWVQQRNKQPQDLAVKEDVLQCDSAELSFALCRFIREVRRPNGEAYTPDSIFYLCLGIQQFLFEKGRIENIFTDELYSPFATEITRMLQHWKPKLLPSGGVVSSRVEEAYLWECKQLGAYSPIVLLNTLLFFCTKTFGFTTLAQQQRLSFANFTRRSKPCSRTGKTHYLRYQRTGTGPPEREEKERLKKKQAEEEGDMEMPENITNPLHCPVRLYEFYLSRCPETVKKRTDVFYLQPEQTVHTNSRRWFTSQPLEGNTLQSMLTRILAVREIHPELKAGQQQQISTSMAPTDGDCLQ